MSARKKFDRKAMVAGLSHRTNASSAAVKDNGKFRDFFDKSKMEGVNKWWPNKGEHLMDIIPYLAGSQDVNVPEGGFTYYLDLFVHKRVGPGEDTYVCPAQYGRACPICEERKRLSDNNADYDTEIQPLNSSRRAIYNVIIRNDKEQEAKGVQLMDMAHWFSEKELIAVSKDPRGGGMINFADPDDGRSIAFNRDGVGATSTSYSGYRLVERDYVITDEEMEAAHCIDELIVIPSYDDLHKAFFGVSRDSDANVADEGGYDDTEPEVEEPEATTPTPRAKPKPKAKPKAKALVCPVGVTFGEDFDSYEDCDSCSIRNECEGACEVPF